MAAGVVPVCTGIGYNVSLIRDQETGFLCRSEQDWYKTLSTLISDAELRNRVATAARSEVIRKFSLRGQAEKMRDLFDHVLSFRQR